MSLENSTNPLYRCTLYPQGQNRLNSINDNGEISINVTGLTSVEIFVPIYSRFLTNNLGYILAITPGQKLTICKPNQKIEEFTINVISEFYNSSSGVFLFEGTIIDDSKWPDGFLIKRNGISVFVMSGQSGVSTPSDLSAYAKRDNSDIGNVLLGSATALRSELTGIRTEINSSADSEYTSGGDILLKSNGLNIRANSINIGDSSITNTILSINPQVGLEDITASGSYTAPTGNSLMTRDLVTAILPTNIVYNDASNVGTVDISTVSATSVVSTGGILNLTGNQSVNMASTLGPVSIDGNTVVDITTAIGLTSRFEANGLMTQTINPTTYAGLVTVAGGGAIPNKTYVNNNFAPIGNVVFKDGSNTGAITIATTTNDVLKIRRNGNDYLTAGVDGSLIVGNVLGQSIISGQFISINSAGQIRNQGGNVQHEATVGNLELTCSSNTGGVSARSKDAGISLAIDNTSFGTIRFSPAVAAASNINISTTNKTALQYATDIDSVISAVPNKIYVDNKILSLINAQLPSSICWCPLLPASQFVFTGTAAQLSTYIASNNNLQEISILSTVEINAPINLLNRVSVKTFGLPSNAIHRFSGTGRWQNPSSRGFTGPSIWGSSLISGAPTDTYIEMNNTGFSDIVIEDLTITTVRPLIRWTGSGQVTITIRRLNTIFGGNPVVNKSSVGAGTVFIIHERANLTGLTANSWVTGTVNVFNMNSDVVVPTQTPTWPQANGATGSIIYYNSSTTEFKTNTGSYVTDISTTEKWLEKLRTDKYDLISNAGAGLSIVKTATAPLITFKTIGATGLIQAVGNVDQVDFSTTAEINTASNVGTGVGKVFKQKTASNLELKSVAAGNNITVTNGTSDVTVTLTPLATVHGYFDYNVTSSGGTQNVYNWIQGTMIANLLNLFTATNDNMFTYTGLVPKNFVVNYSCTPIASSNDRSLLIIAIKNPAVLATPATAPPANPAGYIDGSRITVIARNAIADTASVSNTFIVNLSTSDTLRFYVSNVENNDAVVMSDWRFNITEII